MKKFYIWSISILAVIGIMVIIMFTLFALKNVNIKFENITTNFSAEEIQTEIIKSGNFFYGGCVIFMDKQMATQNIEKAYPYIKVINIETSFPNTFVIHCLEREPLFAIQTETCIYETDEELKVLNIIEESNYISSATNAIYIENFGIENTYSAGNLIAEKNSDVLKNFSTSMKLNNRSLTMQKALFQKLELKDNTSIINLTDTPTLKITDFNGLVALIDDAHERLADKLALFFLVQPLITDTSHSYLNIYEKKDGSITLKEIVYD